jgi:hypothetical protein
VKTYIKYAYPINTLRVRTELADPSLTAVSFYVRAVIHQHHLGEPFSVGVHRALLVVLLLYESVKITAITSTATVSYPASVQTSLIY